MTPFFQLLKTVVDKVQERNEANPDVKTAEKSVFDSLRDKLTGKDAAANTDKNLIEKLRDKVKNSQKENEADPNVETADNSVYDDMMKEIDMLKDKIANQKAELAERKENEVVEPPRFVEQTTTTHSNKANVAMTDSFGGSLQMRMDPDMGSPVNVVNIPDRSQLQIIEYSNNKIILDGKETRFALVDFNGQRGWVLESYLNFN